MFSKQLIPLTILSIAACSNPPTPTASTQSPTIQPRKHAAFKETIQDPPPSLSQFIPENYSILDTTSGNLDLDEYPDMILVLSKNGEDTSSSVTEHPEHRPLLILSGQPGGTYKLVARNDNTVLCIDCGGMMGDPFMGMAIKNGYFSVEHYGGSAWRWAHIITYKYSTTEKKWFLHKNGTESFHASEPDKVETHVKTTKDFGKIPFEKFDIYKED